MSHSSSHQKKGGVPILISDEADFLTEKMPGSNCSPSWGNYWAFAAINKAGTSIHSHFPIPVFYTLKP